jgi:hypothetical protein
MKNLNWLFLGFIFCSTFALGSEEYYIKNKETKMAMEGQAYDEIKKMAVMATKSGSFTFRHTFPKKELVVKIGDKFVYKENDKKPHPGRTCGAAIGGCVVVGFCAAEKETLRFHPFTGFLGFAYDITHYCVGLKLLETKPDRPGAK